MQYMTSHTFPLRFSQCKLRRGGEGRGFWPDAIFAPCYLCRTLSVLYREECCNTETSLQARDLGFQVATIRIEELQAAVSKIAEDAASGNDSPIGIPPQRAKPAGVKPDPKARSFTPGMSLCTDGVHHAED